MEPDKKALQDKPQQDSSENTSQPADNWLEDMRDDLEDYMEEQGSQLRY